MEEILQQSNEEITSNHEPNVFDNSDLVQSNSINLSNNLYSENGQSLSQDPTSDLLLGKFKSVEDLSRAYEELQKHQGHCSDELGSLRKQLSEMKGFQEQLENLKTINTQFSEIVSRDRAKYDSPEYFQDPTFCEIYKEALMVLKDSLDTDKLVTLLDAYANARIFANEKKKSAQNETQKVLDAMTYSKNPKTTFNPPKKRFDEMSEKEIDEMLERLI